MESDCACSYFSLPAEAITCCRMARSSSIPRLGSKKLVSLLRTLSFSKGKAVAAQEESISVLHLPDNVLENILLQAHPFTALALGATCKHLHNELVRHRADVCVKLLSQPENQVQISTNSELKSKSSIPKFPCLSTYLTQRAYTYQLVVRNQWTVRTAEVLLHMLLTQNMDSTKVWTALLPDSEAEKKMYIDCINNCLGAAGIEPQRGWDITLAVRVPVKLSQAEFDALVHGCQPFVRRAREQLAKVIDKSVEDLQLRVVFESVNW